MDTGPTVTIATEEYEELLDASDKLAALQDAGVDNWEGYAEAMAIFYEDEDDDFDEAMDGDFDSGMTNAGFGTDEDYGG